MKKKILDFWPLLIIILFSFVPIAWFSGNLPILGGDVNWPIIPHKRLFRALFVWDDKIGAGFINPLVAASLFPYYLFLWFLEIFNLSLADVQKIVYLLLFLGSGLSMYFLVEKITKNFLPPLLAALFYMFNPYNLVWWSAPDPPPLIAYALFPLLLLFFVKGLEAKRPLTFGFTFGLISLFFAPGATNLTYSVLLLSSLGLLFFFDLFHAIETEERRRNLVRKIKFASGAILAFSLFNAWWLLPVPSFYSEGRAHWIQQDPLENLTSQAKRAKLLNVFRLFGYPGWGDIFRVEKGKITQVFNFHSLEDKTNVKGGFPASLDYTTNPFLIAGSFMLPIIAILGLLIKRKPMLFYFFLLLWLISLFLVKGNNPPLGKIYEFLYLRLPIFSIFRDPYHKFGVLLALSLSVLWGHGSYSLFVYFSERRKTLGKIFLGGAILVFLTLNWPFWTNNVIHNLRGAAPSFHTKIPGSYFQTASWLDNQGESFRVASLPAHGIWTVYDWPYLGVDPLRELSSKPQITQGGGGVVGQNLWNNIFKIVDQGKMDSLARMTGLGGIRYFLLHRDSNWQWYDRERPELIAGKLEKQTGFGKAQTFDKLDFYKLDNRYFLPHFYIPQDLNFLNGGIDGLVDTVSFSDYKTRSGIYMESKINGNLSAGGRTEIEKLKNLEILGRAEEVFVKPEKVTIVARKPRASEEESLVMPNTRILPDSPLYPLIKWKEGRLIRKEKDLLSKTDLLLWLSSKRIVEIERLAGAGKTEIAAEILRRYYRNLGEIVENLEKLARERADSYRLLDEADQYFRKHREEIGKLGNLSTGGRTEIEEIYSLYQKVSLLIPAENRNFYLFNLPKEGDYRLFIKTEEGLEDYFSKNPFASIDFTFDKEKTATFSGVKRDDGWYEYPASPYSYGYHSLSFPEFKPMNLIENGSFEDLSQFKGERFLEPSPEAIEGLQALKITAEDYKDRELVFPIKNFKPSTTYKISFDYKTLMGNPLRFAVWQDRNDDTKLREKEEKGEVVYPYETTLARDSFWQHGEVLFTSGFEAKEGKIVFFLEPDRGKSISLLDNLKVERVYEPEIMLRREIGRFVPQGGAEIGKLPRITFVKINPTKYRVKVEGAEEPYTLIFSESFHNGWKAYIDKSQKSKVKSQNYFGETVASYFDGEIKEGTHRNIFFNGDTLETWGEKSIPEERHLMVNGYANSWYIKPEDSGGVKDYEIIVEFWPQRLFYLGLFISIFTFAGCIIYLVYDKFRNKINA